MSRADEVTDDVARAALAVFYRAMSRKDISLFRTVVTPDWQYIPPSPGPVSGPDSMIPVFADLSYSLPDMGLRIMDVLVHGDSRARDRDWDAVGPTHGDRSHIETCQFCDSLVSRIP